MEIDTQPYREIIAVAKRDYDTLFPLMQKLTQRVNHIRGVINCASDVIGQSVEDEYTYGYQVQLRAAARPPQRSPHHATPNPGKGAVPPSPGSQDRS